MLTTTKVRLVPFSPTVFDALFYWHNDDVKRKQMGGLSVPMREDELLFHYNQFLTGNTAILGVEDDKKEIVGAFMLENIHPRHKRVDFSFIFDVDDSIKKSFPIFFDYIFEERGFDWLHSYIAFPNTKQSDALSSLGFVKRAVIPEYFHFSDGVVSANMYSLHKSKRKDK